MPDPRAAQWRTHALFVATILVGSFLLFLVQPMVARMALPRLGGAPAVWNSAMLVYQALLLGGYAYAHALGRIAPRRQAAIHLAVLAIAALWLPIGLVAMQMPKGANPAIWTPWLLLLSIGPLFLAISAQAPLVQRWFASASGGRDPYALYAASNFGSFAGLIAYPLLVEPGLALGGQSRLWSIGYGLVALLILACATRLPGSAGAAKGPIESAAPGGRRVAHWVALALVPSGMMLATSTYITTDIVAMPLLWVLPLGLYLLSFTVAFADRREPADLLTRIAPITILLFGGIIMAGGASMPWFDVGLALALLFMLSVALHTALYRLRPAADRLTGFYLAMALGGVLGGVFAGLIAPVLFDWTYEYPLLILAAGVLTPQVHLTHRVRALWSGTQRPIALAVLVTALAALFLLQAFGSIPLGIGFLCVALLGLASIGARLPYVVTLASALLLFGGYEAFALTLQPGARTRSYFGVYTVRGDARRVELDHGTTIHGVQLRGSVVRERTPTTYYAAGSGVGQAMRLVPGLYGPEARIGVVGLGTGTLACYAQPGQRWRFYEIDPAIVRIARDTGQFTYLRRCTPDAAIEIGDARLSLERAPADSLDLLALDAFSSDAVPMHLLTTQAFATYGRVLSPHGLLMVHISNRFLHLEPVVAAAAKAGGWQARLFFYRPSTQDRDASGSEWIALSKDPRAIAALTTGEPGWAALSPRRGFVAWTDDYSTILPLMKIWG